MSKIVILIGSVRKKGNTDLLAQAFAAGASIHHEVDIISMADVNVHACTGCNACFQNDTHACVQQDDMQTIYTRLAQADCLVTASPVYFYGISAQLKAVIDRLHTPLRNHFKVRKLGLLLVAAATLPTVFDAIDMQYRLLLDYFNLEDIGTLYVKGVKDKGDIFGHAALQEAYNMGAALP